jgi:hypothetical protein
MYAAPKTIEPIATPAHTAVQRTAQECTR